MIALWMLVAILFALPLALVGALLEPMLLRTRWPARGVWTALLLSAAALPVVRAVQSSSVPVRTSAAAALHADRLRAPEPAATVQIAPGGQTRASSSMGSTSFPVRAVPPALNDAPAAWSVLGTRRVSERVDRIMTRAAPWDRRLVVLWGATFLALLSLLAIAIPRQSRGVGRDVTTATFGDEVVSEAAVAVVLTESIGPAATGIVRPRILLPRWALALDPGSRALMLRHEREHLAAHDPALLLAAALLVALLPWNLPLWWMARRWRAAIEMDCDARVLRGVPDVRRYAELLLLVGERAARSASSLAHAPLLMLTARRSALLRRVDVMTRPRAGSRRMASVLCLCAIAVVVLLGVAMPAPRPLPLAQSARLSSRMLFTNMLASSQSPAMSDSAVFDMRAVFGAGALFTGHGWHPLLSPARWSPSLFEIQVARGRMFVTSGVARPVTVLLYVETKASSRALADTQRFVTPFVISRSFSSRALHLRSVNDEPFNVAAEIATAPGFRQMVTSAHIILDGRVSGSPDRSVTWINPGRAARCIDHMPWSLRDDRSCP